MSPVITVLDARVTPERAADLQAAYAEAARGPFPLGLVRSALLRHASDPNQWRIETIWESQEAAGALHRSTKRDRARVTLAFLATFVLGYAAVWFLFNLGRMPPDIPGASTDPTFAPPKTVAGLAVVTSALVLPGSALACALAFRRRGRMLRRASTSRASA